MKTIHSSNLKIGDKVWDNEKNPFNVVRTLFEVIEITKDYLHMKPIENAYSYILDEGKDYCSFDKANSGDWYLD